MRRCIRASAVVLSVLLVCIHSASSAALRSSRSTPQSKVQDEPQESVRFDESAISLVEVSSTVSHKPVELADSFFGYKQANDHSKKVESHHEAKQEPRSSLPAFTAANSPRFARTQTTIGTAASVWPSLPTATTQGQGGPYTFGAARGRGGADYNAPMYGTFGSNNYGPMGGPRTSMMGMGSFPNSINPRGFGMVANMSEPWNTPGGGMPYGAGAGFGFGKPMLEGKPFPAKLEGYTMDNSQFGGGGMYGGGGYYGQAPFTGNPFSAMGPYGPFKLASDKAEQAKAPPSKNTTLMGPLPFGPYGGLPSGVSQVGGMMGGFPGQPWNAGLMQGVMGGAPYMGPQSPGWGWGAGAQTMGGLHSTYNPMIAMHHEAMMGGGTQTFSPPGLVHGSGAGYPEPDFDRYHSVIRSPPIPFGGAEAAAAF